MAKQKPAPLDLLVKLYRPAGQKFRQATGETKMSKHDTHARFFELETEALIEVGYFDENGKPKTGPEGQRLWQLAHENMKKAGICLPG